MAFNRPLRRTFLILRWRAIATHQSGLYLGIKFAPDFSSDLQASVDDINDYIWVSIRFQSMS